MLIRIAIQLSLTRDSGCIFLGLNILQSWDVGIEKQLLFTYMQLTDWLKESL